jgi:hypothetical protein
MLRRVNNLKEERTVSEVDKTRMFRAQHPERCCIERCGQVATHKAGGEVYFPFCDAHYQQLYPLCAECGQAGILEDGRCVNCRIVKPRT